VIVVSNSSPLITLARIGRLALLKQLFGRIHIAGEVREEVVRSAGQIQGRHECGDFGSKREARR